MRLSMLLALLGAHEVAPTSALPPPLEAGREVVRISGGQVELVSPDGHPEGARRVGAGWYATPLAYARYDQDTLNLELEMERARARADSCAQLATATCAAAAAAHTGYSPQALAAVGLLCLGLGLALGMLHELLTRRHPTG